MLAGMVCQKGEEQEAGGEEQTMERGVSLSTHMALNPDAVRGHLLQTSLLTTARQSGSRVADAVKFMLEVETAMSSKFDVCRNSFPHNYLTWRIGSPAFHCKRLCPNKTDKWNCIGSKIQRMTPYCQKIAVSCISFSGSECTRGFCGRTTRGTGCGCEVFG